MKKEIKDRLVFACAILLLCVSALYTRHISTEYPCFFTKYYPDTAWTMAVYCGFGILLNKGVKINFPAALLFSYAIEISQLFSPPFLVAARSTVVGGLIFGYGFLWSDIVCYTAGGIICVMIEFSAKKLTARLSKSGG